MIRVKAGSQARREPADPNQNGGFMNITESVNLYLDDKDVYCSSVSCDYYKTTMGIYTTFLESKNIKDTDKLNEKILKDFVVYLRGKKIKNTSINTYMRAVKNYSNWGICNGIIPPFDYHIKLPRPDPEQILPLSTAEVNTILKYIREQCLDPQNKELFFRLLLDCGMRSQEALNLSGDDIDLDKGIIMINKSKYDKSRMIPLPDPVRKLIPETSGKLFTFDKAGKNSLFTRLHKRTGITRLHAHLLRHTFATSYMVNVGNLEFLRMYMGHSTYNVTKTYIQSAYECRMLKYDIYKIDGCFS